MFRFRSARFAVAVALLTAVGACSDDGSGTTGVAPTVAGPSGGTFTLATGVTIAVPAGAIAQPIQLSVSVDQNGAGVSDEHRLGPVYTFSPAGTSFATAAAVSIPGAQGERPLVVTRGPGGELVVLENGAVDGASARGGLYRLGPVWVSDRGNVVEQLDVVLPVEKLVVGSDEPLGVSALNLAGDAIALDGITFTTSDPEVVTVSAEGEVSGRNIGTATVTATLRGVSRSVEIEVAAGGPTRLELLPTTLEVARRDSAQLVVRAYDAAGNDAEVPEEGILFSTTDGNVLRVNPRGVVFAVNSGTADVIATASIEASVLTATATVTVPAPIPSGLRVMPRNPTVGMGKTRTLVAQTLDEFGEPIAADASPAVTWTSLDTDVATIDAAGVVTGVALGDARIVATSANANAGADTVRLAVGTGDASGLEILRQPAGAPAASPLVTQPIVRLVDSFGNAVEFPGITIRAVLESGAGTLTGGTTAETDAKGIATFSNLGITGVGNYVLRFEANGVTPVSSSVVHSLDPMVLVFAAPGSNTITLPFAWSPDNTSRYSITVDWGDGSCPETYTWDDGQAISHTYSARGSATTVQVYGLASHFGNPEGWTGNTLLQRVDSWGWLELKSLEGAFTGASQLTTVPSTLPESVYTIASMFDGASVFNQDISNWDVSNILSMHRLFADATAFNNDGQPLSWGHRTNNVTDMAMMFLRAASFNQDLHEWDVSNVTTMYGMFREAVSFNNGGFGVERNAPAGIGDVAPGGNHPLEWGIGTRKVTNMSKMFYDADSFNQDISSWDVSRVLTMDHMFDDADVFNNGCATLSYDCPLDWAPDERPTREVTDMSYMFRNADSFNQDISSWDVSHVTSMAFMFYENDAFNNGCAQTIAIIGDQPVAASHDTWCPLDWFPSTENVANMTSMFEEANAFNQDISSWDVGNVTTMHRMFAYADVYNNGCTVADYDCPLDWPAPSTQNVTDMSEMFDASLSLSEEPRASVSFNQDISSWNVSSVTTMAAMFRYHDQFNNGCPASLLLTDGVVTSAEGGDEWCPLDWGANTRNVTTMEEMLEDALVFNQSVSSWDVSSVVDMQEMFNNALSFNNGCAYDDLSCPVTWGATTSNVETMKEMFDLAVSFNQDVSGWNVSSVTTMEQMFKEAYSFNNGCDALVWGQDEDDEPLLIDGSEDTSCPLDWGSNTRSIETLEEMFEYAWSFNQDVSSWDLSSVTTVEQMFKEALSFNNGCEDEEWCELEWGATTASIANMSAMFREAISFNQYVSSWDVSGATDMSSMFKDATSYNNGCGAAQYNCELDWGPNTRNVTTMWSMFYDADSFDQDVSGWDLTSATTLESMFYDADEFNNGCPDVDAIGALSCPLNWETTTKNVMDMSYMFFSADEFNQAVGDWDVSRVESMTWMFADAVNFNNGCVVGDTNCPIQWTATGSIGGASLTGNVRYMSRMFKNAVDFNQPLNHWDVSSVTSMLEMFMDADDFNQNLDDWDVRSVTTMQGMFAGAHVFNGVIGSWRPERVTDMGHMFRDAHDFNQDIGGWDVSSVTTMDYMFTRAYDFNQYIGGWDVRAVSNMVYMFRDADDFLQDLSRWCVPLIGSEPVGFDLSADNWYPRFDWGDDWAGRDNEVWVGYWTINYDWGRPRFGCWTP